MNEITRIHIAKIAYDIEINAKKQLEKYIKSLEIYAQDAEVLEDIEIRMTELLAERKVLANGIINSDDVAALRAQLGEPYEFAGDDGDIAVGGINEQDETHRLYRSLDDAVLGGVLSGFAAYLKVNVLWTRLAFLFLTFISFGLAIPLYLVFWVAIPAARTAAQKLHLAGKPVTVDSIRTLNTLSETDGSTSIAPVVKRVIAVTLAIFAIIGAVLTLATVIWGLIFVMLHNGMQYFYNWFVWTGNKDSWLGWLMFWIILGGALLLTALFTLIAYALLAKKLTKKMVISGIIIIVLGIASVGTVGGLTASQSWRVANEAQAAVQVKKMNLPAEFSTVKSVVFDNPESNPQSVSYSAVSNIQYIVDNGTPRYELSALPKAKLSLKVENGVAHVSMNIPEDYRNGFVSPSLVIYGPSLDVVETNGVQVTYSTAQSQESLAVKLTKNFGTVSVNGTFKTVSAEGEGSVDLTSSGVQSLTVKTEKELSVNAGTVRNLDVTQPDSCASTTYKASSTVSVSGVTSGMMTYNGKEIPAKTFDTNCASVVVGEDIDEDAESYDDSSR